MILLSPAIGIAQPVESAIPPPDAARNAGPATASDSASPSSSPSVQSPDLRWTMVPPGLTAIRGDRLRQALSAPVSIAQQNAPLRPTLARLASVTGVPIVLDRRVDPHLTTPEKAAPAEGAPPADDSSPGDTRSGPTGDPSSGSLPTGRPGRLEPVALPLWQTLERLAAPHGLTVTLVGDVVWIGPPDRAEVLAETLAARLREIARLSAASRSRLTRVGPLAWPSVAVPEEVFRSWCDRHGVRPAETLQPDLWPEVTLPSVDFATGATLILAQFGQTFQLDAEGRALERVLLPERTETSGDRHRALLASRWSDPTWRRILTGEAIPATPVRDGSRPSVSLRDALSRNRHTLRQADVPPRALLLALERQIGVPITVDPAAEEALATRIDVQVTAVPTEELLRQVLGPLGLVHELTDGAIRVRPR